MQTPDRKPTIGCIVMHPTASAETVLAWVASYHARRSDRLRWPDRRRLRMLAGRERVTANA